jgi:hypothetical protein
MIRKLIARYVDALAWSESFNGLSSSEGLKLLGGRFTKTNTQIAYASNPLLTFKLNGLKREIPLFGCFEDPFR